MLEANKVKSELSLAPHEWKSLYDQLDPVLTNGANSIRHLEGCVLIIIDEIKNRYANKK